jgi:hypothetical protein
MPHRRLFAAALLAGWALPAAAAFAQKAEDPSFSLVNRGNRTVKELYVTPGGDANWGRNRLDRQTIPPAGKFAVRLRRDGNCIFDVRVVFADGSREERRGLNTCTLGAVAVGGPETGGPQEARAKAANDPSFRLVNRGAVAIEQLYATPAGRGNWGENRLASSGLPADTATLVHLAPGDQCLYDLRVVFADHKALEKRRADLCRITDLPVP